MDFTSLLLHDAPSTVPADAKFAAEARYARELERALGRSAQVATTLATVLSLEWVDEAYFGRVSDCCSAKRATVTERRDVVAELSCTSP